MSFKILPEIDRGKTGNENRLIASMAAAVLILILLFPPAGLARQGNESGPEGESIGRVDFGVSCKKAVQDDFDHALGMLHHMMYVKSRAVFEEIIEAEPDCAMAYWGVATTLFQPLWDTRPSEDQLERGRRHIEKARGLDHSEREGHLIESTAAFFREPETAEYHTRFRRWADAMKTAYEAHPDDPDIAALYGLSRLALAQRAEDPDPLYDEAEAVLRKVFERVPKHPGAIHYSIHATDVDGRARNALDMVEVYGKIAPEVPHALHMPSHIYVRLGDWPKVIDWNRRSAEAALKHPANGAVSHHYIHAVDYLIYAYLQRGEDDRAGAAFEEAQAKQKYQPTFISTFHIAAMPARMAVEQHDWKRAAALTPRTPQYLPWDESPWAEGLIRFARGIGAAHMGDIEAAGEAERHLGELRDRAKAADNEHMATYIEIDRRVLAGRIAYARKEPEKAVELTRSAAELEKTVEKHPVTPGALLPPYEAVGDLLMNLDRPDEALEAYEASDAIWPGRYNTLLGAARAAREAGDERTARKHYERLLAKTGDSERAGLKEADAFLEK